jgi:hypothetical protein
MQKGDAKSRTPMRDRDREEGVPAKAGGKLADPPVFFVV